MLVSYVDSPDYETMRSQSLPAAERAVALNPDLGMTHTSLADAYLSSDRVQEAEREFVRAIESSPQYATARGWYSLLLLGTGRADEAVVQAGIGVESDPVSQAVNSQYGLALGAAGRLEEAVDQFRRTTGAHPQRAGSVAESVHRAPHDGAV